ncbi:hypothetical protein [Paenibacillus sp. OK003]|uniref:hypothetical protein n=1 Tax=Paenibacillus sp. OK003 TaxID=1884380 RepID=UPI0008AD3016|nr:hypothetical protein [Paenibacillus sp. OK003]SEL19909.1 hypothetical protein SAMN05518856_108240 [Paenibacillus sp. OK003]
MNPSLHQAEDSKVGKKTTTKTPMTLLYQEVIGVFVVLNIWLWTILEWLNWSNQGKTIDVT